jgi:hypothetical protein
MSLFVKNVNDNVPVFKQKIYTFSAPLSTRRFTALGQVRVQPLQGIVSGEKTLRTSGQSVFSKAYPMIK